MLKKQEDTDIIETHILDDNDLDIIGLALQDEPDLAPYFLHSRSPNFWEGIEQLKYGVVVIDYKLSEGPTGKDILQQLNDRDEDECFYKIVETAHPGETMLMDFLRLRPNDFVIKRDANDGVGHMKDLMAAIRKGRAHVRKHKEKERKRDQKIQELLQMAENIGKQIEPFKSKMPYDDYRTH